MSPPAATISGDQTVDDRQIFCREFSVGPLCAAGGWRTKSMTTVIDLVAEVMLRWLRVANSGGAKGAALHACTPGRFRKNMGNPVPPAA
jgi:hypothetical protein